MPRVGTVHRVVAEVGQLELLAQQAAVGVRVRAHAPVPLGRQRLQLRHRACPSRVEQLLGPVAAHPVFEHLQVRRVARARRRTAPGASARSPPACARPAPSARSSPWASAARSSASADASASSDCARLLLHGADLVDGALQRLGHLLVHRGRIAALDEVRLVAVADEQRLQLLVADAREDGRVGDLVAVEVQDRQHRAVAHRIDELVRVPRRRERSGLRLAVAHDAGDDQVGVVEAPCRTRARGCSRARRLRGSSPASPA